MAARLLHFNEKKNVFFAKNFTYLQNAVFGWVKCVDGIKKWMLILVPEFWETIAEG